MFAKLDSPLVGAGWNGCMGIPICEATDTKDVACIANGWHLKLPSHKSETLVGIFALLTASSMGMMGFGHNVCWIRTVYF